VGEGLGQVVTGAQGTGAVSIRMGTAEVAWMRRQTSKPSRGGIRTSSTTTSGPSSAKCRGAVPPSAATSARQVRPDQARREGDYQGNVAVVIGDQHRERHGVPPLATEIPRDPALAGR